MNNYSRIGILSSLFLLLTGCAHLQTNHTQSHNCSIPIYPVEGLPLTLTVEKGRPIARLNGKVISKDVDFPVDLSKDDNTNGDVSLRSIEQITLIKVKGSCYYFSCVGNNCTKFELPPEYCN